MTVVHPFNAPLTPAELMRAARRLEIRCRREWGNWDPGLAPSRGLDRGLEFEEVRPYAPGDDVRAIDWKVSARSGRPFIKRFAPERRRLAWLLVDTGPSLSFSSQPVSKLGTVAQAASLIAMALALPPRDDRVGLLTFGGSELLIPPARGRHHGLCLARALLALPPTFAPGTTNLAGAAQRLARMARVRSLVFVLSDFLAPEPARALRALARRHDVVALHVIDPWERCLPARGLVRFRDASGREHIVDTGDPRYRAAYADQARRRVRKRRREFAAARVSWTLMPTERGPIATLLRHFGRPGSPRAVNRAGGPREAGAGP